MVGDTADMVLYPYGASIVVVVIAGGVMVSATSDMVLYPYGILLVIFVIQGYSCVPNSIALFFKSKSQRLEVLL